MRMEVRLLDSRRIFSWIHDGPAKVYLSKHACSWVWPHDQNWSIGYEQKTWMQFLSLVLRKTRHAFLPPFPSSPWIDLGHVIIQVKVTLLKTSPTWILQIKAEHRERILGVWHCETVMVALNCWCLALYREKKIPVLFKSLLFWIFIEQPTRISGVPETLLMDFWG